MIPIIASCKIRLRCLMIEELTQLDQNSKTWYACKCSAVISLLTVYKIFDSNLIWWILLSKVYSISTTVFENGGIDPARLESKYPVRLQVFCFLLDYLQFIRYLTFNLVWSTLLFKKFRTQRQCMPMEELTPLGQNPNTQFACRCSSVSDYLQFIRYLTSNLMEGRFFCSRHFRIQQQLLYTA